MKHRFVLVLVAAAIAAGCVKPPKTAEGFREMARSGSRWVAVDRFVVDRPYREVARTFQKRSDACLKVRVVTESRGGYMSHATTFRQDYRPTVRVDRRRAEFFVQMHIEGTNLIKVYDESQGGDYIMVADAYPVGRRKTRIELHHATMGHDVLTKAVRGWATGENLGCPDLTK